MLAITVAVSSCSSGENMNNPNTTTQQQAIARIEKLISEAVATLGPNTKMELISTSLEPMKCLEPSDGGSEDRIVVSRSYYLPDISKDRTVEAAEKIKKHWETQGHEITVFRGAEPGGPSISGRTRPDDFLFSLTTTQDGVIDIGANSTCIWPNGTPEPKKP
ncbi:hypothetical protein [Sinosporangium album]|nr:hypothetical protein [Sinosporangium album]